MKQDYPKWLYSAERALIVASADEHAALEGKWYESPADIPSGDPVPVDRASLVAQAEAKGVKVDKRWSDARLSTEIEKA